MEFGALDRAEDRAELAEALLENVGETLVVDLALVVFHHPTEGRPTVFGGRFDDRRRVGRTLRLRVRDADKGVAAVGSALGPSVRVVRVGDTSDLQGMIIVGSAVRGLRGDEIDHVRELAEAASRNLLRLDSDRTTSEDDRGGAS
jgi:hypothetical protein